MVSIPSKSGPDSGKVLTPQNIQKKKRQKKKKKKKKRKKKKKKKLTQ